MEHNSRLHCSDCVRLGRPCVDLSWEHLNHTRKECQAMIDEDQKELARIFARLTRNLDTLHQAEYCAHQKTECLAKELEASGILEPLDSRFAAR